VLDFVGASEFKLVESLAEAIADCTAAFALSARPREWSTQVLDVRAAAARLDAGRKTRRGVEIAVVVLLAVGVVVFLLRRRSSKLESRAENSSR